MTLKKNYDHNFVRCFFPQVFHSNFLCFQKIPDSESTQNSPKIRQKFAKNSPHPPGAKTLQKPLKKQNPPKIRLKIHQKFAKNSLFKKSRIHPKSTKDFFWFFSIPRGLSKCRGLGYICVYIDICMLIYMPICTRHLSIYIFV